MLSTQNPVDLDYKAMSNAGTWLVGRLQTENDKARVLEGLRSAAGTTDVAELDRAIGGLGKRQFLLVSAKANAPRLLATRWAMSYLCGPLTKEQVAKLEPAPSAPADRRAPAASAEPKAAAPPAAAAPARPRLRLRHLSASSRPTRPPSRRPSPPVSPCRISTGRRPGQGRRCRPGRGGFARSSRPRVLRYDDSAADVDEQEEFEAGIARSTAGSTSTADPGRLRRPRLRGNAPPPPVRPPQAPSSDATFFRRPRRTSSAISSTADRSSCSATGH